MKLNNTKIFSAYFGAILLLVISASSSFAQTDKKDLYKEFDEFSFKDAGPVKIKDSSIISQHLIGIKGGYSIINLKFSQDIAHKPATTPINFGVYYTYYHSLWNSMPFFGVQTGLEYSEMGYNIVNKDSEGKEISSEKETYRAIELPLVSQFRIDFWKMRILANVGMYGSYKISTNISGGIPSTTNKLESGVIAGGGLAYKFHPFELQFECNYRYAFSHFYDPKKYSEQYWVFAQSNRIIFSLGLFIHLDKKKK